MNICKLFSKITQSKTRVIFSDRIGYNDLKRLLKMALDTDKQSHLLLSGRMAKSMDDIQFLVGTFLNH